MNACPSGLSNICGLITASEIRETIWQGENIDATFTKVYDCRIQDGRIVVHGSLAGVSRVPVLRHTLSAEIHTDGAIRLCLEAKVREGAVWLPRLGFEFTMPEQKGAFSYFGRGPSENYCDMSHCAQVGWFERRVCPLCAPAGARQPWGCTRPADWPAVL